MNFSINFNQNAALRNCHLPTIKSVLVIPVPRTLPDPFTMLSRMFYKHGHLCASHPWEVILIFLTFTICFLSMGPTTLAGHSVPMCGINQKCSLTEESKGLEVVILTIARCMAVLYVYYQFRKLYKLGSKYLVGIAGLFTVLSSFVFTSTVVNVLDGNLSELNVALPFFLLLMDFSKAGLLAQFALSSSSKEEIRLNIAQGMAILGPTITLDTLVEALVIGVGTLSGVKRLETMCCFACMSALVNYAVFMTFFPACLSLVLELSRDREEGRPMWQISSLKRVLRQEEEQKPNPVLQRVKVIMSAGLLIVHAHSRWPFPGANLDSHNSPDSPLPVQPPILDTLIYRWFSVSTEQMILLILTGAITIKYIFFETKVDHASLLPHSTVVRPVETTPLQEQPRAPLRKASWPLVTSDLQSTSPSYNFTPSSSSGLTLVSFTLGGEEESLKGSLEKETQTEDEVDEEEACQSKAIVPPRTLEECKALLESKAQNGVEQLTDEEILLLVENRVIVSHKLEKVLDNPLRAIVIRRLLISKQAQCALNGLPFINYDYTKVMGNCCENVIGYVPVPIGVAGPLLMNGRPYFVPMATTEGCLVASTNRGCRALSMCGGVTSFVEDIGMTRAPLVQLPNVELASKVLEWLKAKENFVRLKEAFDSTSRFARLKEIQPKMASCNIHIRFVATTGDAMGMNMLSKGTEKALKILKAEFPLLHVCSVSGNFCTDKKPAATNWIMGRGKSVVCDAEVPEEVVRRVLKTTPQALVDLNINKNYEGSALAGSLGGFNAQASNIVTAIYIATGQDPAQNVGSSNCLTTLKLRGPNLYASCTMPSIEVGTVGGGTVLQPQSVLLELLGIRGPSTKEPGANSARLAQIVCGAVLAGELSLLSALAEGHLVESHMTHNRSWARTDSTTLTSAPTIVPLPPPTLINKKSPVLIKN